MCRITVVLFALTVSASAQWINYPSPGTPRTADGKPNLAAPAPRAADGHPDLSGIWDPDFVYAPVPPGVVIAANGGFTLQAFRPDAAPIPMTPWADAIFKERDRNFGVGRPASFCLPHSIPDAMVVDSFKIVQNPGLTLILYEEFARFRQIFTDGRSHPNEMNPAWLGYSIGKWDGDTLVVDTRGFNDRSWLDDAGHPHSDALHTVERLRRTDFGHMNVEVTVEDAKAYTQPWSFTLNFKLLPDTELIEDVCDNEQDGRHVVGRASSDDQKRGIDVAPAILAAYAGAYEFKIPGVAEPKTYYVSVSGGRLVFDGAELAARSETEFFMNDGGFGQFTFFRDAQGKAARLVADFGDFKMEGVLKPSQ